MKKCELCDSPAKMHCESDQASLCWDCDSKVHGANFLVAKHSRTLLCHACQSPTPWTGSGPRLAPTISVCDSCANGSPNTIDQEQEHGEGDKEVDDDNDDDDDDDGDNQVVPLSPTPVPASAPATVSSSSSSEESFYT